MVIHWKRGEPYPEDWPDWLKEANIEWCDVEVSDEGRSVVWYEGVWYHGTWHGGTWRGGTWSYGHWKNGTWENGLWKDGVWGDGTWESGVWQSGNWCGGTWIQGDWVHGIWQGGIWKGGTWESGVWLRGAWEGGHQRQPRFGWRATHDGRIHGILGTSRVLPSEEWEPLLKDMDPEKVDEFYTLLHWMKLQERRKKIEGPRASVWDHIEDDA